MEASRTLELYVGRCSSWACGLRAPVSRQLESERPTAVRRGTINTPRTKGFATSAGASFGMGSSQLAAVFAESCKS